MYTLYIISITYKSAVHNLYSCYTTNRGSPAGKPGHPRRSSQAPPLTPNPPTTNKQTTTTTTNNNNYSDNNDDSKTNTGLLALTLLTLLESNFTENPLWTREFHP